MENIMDYGNSLPEKKVFSLAGFGCTKEQNH